MNFLQQQDDVTNSVKFWSRMGLIQLDEATKQGLDNGTVKVDPFGQLAASAKVFDTQMQNNINTEQSSGANFAQLRESVLKDDYAETLKSLNEEAQPGQQVGDPGPNGLPLPIEANPTTLLTMTRKVLQQNIANAFFGVQPMTSSTQSIFAVRARYRDSGNPIVSPADTEALYNDIKTGYSGDKVADAGISAGFPLGYADDTAGSENPDANPSFGQGMLTSTGQALGSDTGDDYNEMGFTLEKTSVEAKSRKLRATLSQEVEQDLRAIHQMSAVDLVSNIMTTEIQSEVNRELILTMNLSAKYGNSGTAIQGGVEVQKPGITNMDGAEIEGRWSAEKYKSLLFRIDSDANAIARDTRRGKGNVMICTPNIASALIIGGMIDYAPALASLNDPTKVDITLSTYVGKLATGQDVHVDPYALQDYYTIGFKGSNVEAGIFFCPYTMLESISTTSSETLQFVKGMSTRYGKAANPYYAKNGDGTEPPGKGLGQNENGYYRKSMVLNLR